MKKKKKKISKKLSALKKSIFVKKNKNKNKNKKKR